MSDEEFEQQKTGLITRLLEKPKTLGGRSRRFWNEIECRQYDFDRSGFPSSFSFFLDDSKCALMTDNSEVEVLRNVTKEDLLQYFDRKFSKKAPERRKVILSSSQLPDLFFTQIYRVQRT